MPSLIANCLARLVRQGLVSEKAARDAQALHDGMQGRLGEEMGPASADAAGALEAARVMAEQAKARKVSIAKQAITLQDRRAQMNAHPRGAVAGLNALLSRDPFEKGTAGGPSVDTATEVIQAKLDAMFGPGNEALGSKFAGLRQDRELARTVIRENFGEDTGNAAAKQISNGWKTASDYAATRAKAGGKMFNLAEDWRQPQFWTSERVRHFGETEFTADIEAWLNRGGLRVMDKETGAAATPLQVPAVVQTAFRDITAGGGRGGAGFAFSPEMRVFRFAEGKAGADAYLALMEKYGPGTDLYGMMRGHLHSAAREIALIEQFGPNYRANFRVLHGEAAGAERTKTAKKIPVLSSAYGADKTFRMLTGELTAVENEALAGIMAGGRAWLTAVQLGGATLSAVPGDSATILLAARHNGISGARIIADTLRTMAADSPELRAEAARLGIQAYAAADSAIGQSRYADQWLDPRWAGKVASTVIRASGLQAWTEAAKRSTTMALLGKVASEAGKGYKAVSPEFRAFLDRYGISAKEWDALRKTPLMDAGDGATFFDAGAVADRALGEKLMGAIIDERHFFVLEPTASGRAVLAPSAPRGTLTGELARSFGMYKTFAVSMLNTHMMRAANQPTAGGKAAYALSLAATTTMFGALAIAMKDIANGKDPRSMALSMDNKSFWMAAAVQGGGLGILGDLLNSGFTRADTSLAGTLGGPLAAAIDAGSTLIFPTVRKAVAGEEINFGAALARQMKRYILPSTFYTRLATDRLFWDQIQTLIDPEYRQSFRRIEQNARRTTGNAFWWRPGDAAPDRVPDLGAALRP